MLQITSLTVVHSTVYSGADQRKHQSSASLAFANSPHKEPLTQKMFPFDDVFMWESRKGVPVRDRPDCEEVSRQIVRVGKCLYVCLWLVRVYMCLWLVRILLSMGVNFREWHCHRAMHNFMHQCQHQVSSDGSWRQTVVNFHSATNVTKKFSKKLR